MCVTKGLYLLERLLLQIDEHVKAMDGGSKVVKQKAKYAASTAGVWSKVRA